VADIINSSNNLRIFEEIVINLCVTIVFGYFQNENALLQHFYGIMEEKKSRDPKLSTNILIMELLTVLNKKKMSLEARYSFLFELS
jgi:hypothetical protein